MLSLLVGGLQASQATEGRVALFNMWSYEMSLQQLNSLTCDSVGDMVTQTDMQIGGSSQFSYEVFDCDGEYNLVWEKYYDCKGRTILKYTTILGIRTYLLMRLLSETYVLN